MKFIAFSDTHGQHDSKKLNKFFNENQADILLFAGDLQLNHFDKGEDFIEWLHNLPQKYKVVIFGNHDGNFEYALEKAKEYLDIFILHNSGIEIEGIKIWGSPNSLLFCDWFFMKTDKELDEIYKEIPNNVDILITHTPPFGILDMNKDKVLTGSISLLNRIRELKNLKYHIFGHIHECSGECDINPYTDINFTKFINVSVLDEKYSLKHDPIIFEI